MNASALFSQIRKMLHQRGSKLRQDEVDALNAIIEGRIVPEPPSAPEKPEAPWRVSPEGEALIKQFEGCHRKRADGRFEAYPDPGTGGEPWTIGWGATGWDTFNQRPIGRGTIWTQEQCDERLKSDLERYAREVATALGKAIHATSQEQFDALVSFHYNTGAIARATLTRKHIAGDYAGAAAEFGRWNRAGGKVLPGLTRRRAAEAALYRKGSR